MRWISVFLVACIPTSQSFVRYDAVAVVASVGSAQASGWTVTLDDARIGFGPMYFCASELAKPELCASAAAELTTQTTVDLLSAQPQSLGRVYGLTGQIRSVVFDYGISWFTTQTEPTASDAAPDGHSAVFHGTASNGTQTLTFLANIDIPPSQQGTRAVLGTRVNGNIATNTERMSVTFDPLSWWATVDFSELVKKGGNPVEITSDMQAYTSLVSAMQANFPPLIRWSTQ